jgi:hypothetical protein
MATAGACEEMGDSPDRPALARTEAIAALASHPAIAEAVRRVVTGLVARYEARGPLSRLVSDRNRFLLSYMALYLDAGYDEADPRSGLTVASYKQLCAGTGLCRSETAQALLWLMRLAGYVVPAPDARRGMPQRFVPSDHFLAHHRSRWHVLFDALTQLRPEGATGLALIHDPAFGKRFIRATCDRFLARERVLAHAPALTLFAGRRAGFNIVMAMMLSAHPGDDMPPRGPMSTTADALARRFAIPRRQVRETLAMAVAAGLLVPTGDDAYVMTEALRTSIVNFTCAMLLVAGEAITEAEGQLRAGGHPRAAAQPDHAA